MLVFKSKELIPILEGAVATKSDVLLVKDEGVYLIADNGQHISDKNLIAYAEGCDPRTDEACWETSREECGGDDFAEHLSGGGGNSQGILRILNAAKVCKKIVVTLTEDNIVVAGEE